MPNRDVPSFDVHEFHERQSDYCLCVFVINESGRLETQLERMKAFCRGVDIVIADGGSSDGSTDESLLKSFGVNSLLTKTGPGKLGAQMRMAFAWAIERGYRGVVCMDGNNKDDPVAVPEFINRLDSGHDHIQGSRFVPGGVSENLPLSRWAGLKLLHAPLISIASRYPYTDTTNGFRAYSTRLLNEPRVSVFREVFSGYELHYYLAVRAARLGFRVCEIPVTRRYPARGATPTKISPIRGNLRVLWCLFATVLGAYNPRVDVCCSIHTRELE